MEWPELTMAINTNSEQCLSQARRPARHLSPWGVPRVEARRPAARLVVRPRCSTCCVGAGPSGDHGEVLPIGEPRGTALTTSAPASSRALRVSESWRRSHAGATRPSYAGRGRWSGTRIEPAVSRSLWAVAGCQRSQVLAEHRRDGRVRGRPPRAVSDRLRPDPLPTRSGPTSTGSGCTCRWVKLRDDRYLPLHPTRSARSVTTAPATFPTNIRWCCRARTATRSTVVPSTGCSTGSLATPGSVTFTRTNCGTPWPPKRSTVDRHQPTARHPPGHRRPPLPTTTQVINLTRITHILTVLFGCSV
jgi:hypothetical protein